MEANMKGASNLDPENRASQVPERSLTSFIHEWYVEA